MRNLNFNGESGSEPYTPTAQTSGVTASDAFYSSEFRGDFGAGLLDLHAMDDTELLSEVGSLCGIPSELLEIFTLVYYINCTMMLEWLQ